MKPIPVKVYLAAVSLCVVWAAFLTLSKYVLSSGLVSTTGVTVVQRAATTLALIIPFMRIPPADRRFGRRHVGPILAVAAILTTFTYLYFWAFRLYDQGVANSAVLYRTDLIFAIVMGRVLLNERVRPAQYVALAGMVGGVLVFTGFSPAHVRFDYWIGDLLIVMTAFLLTCNAFIIRIKLAECHSTVTALYNNVASFGILLVIYAGLQMAKGTVALDVTALASHPGLLAANVAVGLVGAGVFLLYYYCLLRMPVWEVRAILLFIPLFAYPMARLAPELKETMSKGQIGGMILVIAAGLWLMFQSRGVPDGPRPERGEAV